MIDQYPSPNGVLTSLIWRKTAAGGETSLSGYDNASQALSYTPGQEQVYLNGILLVRGDDYTATNGTSITGLAALTANDFVQINCYNNFSVASLPSTSITGEISNNQITSLATSKLTGTIANNQLANSSITINGSAVSLGGSTTIAGGSAQDDAPTSPTEGQLWLDTNGTLATTAFVEKGDISAKGDLFVGSANDTVSILNVGESGSTIVSDSAATTGLRWQDNFAAGKNKIINGDFGIWQRGTSSTSVGYATADRWYCGTDATFTVSQQTFTPGTAPVAGYEGQYYIRLAKNSGGSYVDLRQYIENVRTFAGQTVTLSFWAKCGSGTESLEPYYSQNFGSGGSAGVSNSVTAQTITTSWARYSFTFTLPSVSGKTIGANSYLLIYAARSISSSSARTIDVWGVQLEAGSVATAFQTATGNPASELAACLYYFNRIADFSSGGSNGHQMIVTAQNFATTGGYGVLQYPKMRISPTVTFSGNTDFIATGAGGNNIATTAMAANQIKPNSAEIRYTTAGNLVAGNAALLYTSTTAGKLDLSAEL